MTAPMVEHKNSRRLETITKNPMKLVLTVHPVSVWPDMGLSNPEKGD